MEGAREYMKDGQTVLTTDMLKSLITRKNKNKPETHMLGMIK